MTQATPQVPKPRIQSLSDLIFGLALSIGAIVLVGSLPTTPGDLTYDLLYFGFSFLILINVWNRYTTTSSVMPIETPGMVRTNILLLFLVAIEPFLFDVLSAKGFGSTVASQASSAVITQASVYYAFDVGGMNLILAYFSHILTVEERNLIPKEMVKRYRRTRDVQIGVASIFLISALPLFWGTNFVGIPLRIIMWILALPAAWLPRLLKASM